MKSLISAALFAIVALEMTLISCTSSVPQILPFYAPNIDTAEMRKVQESITDFVPREWTADPDMIRELSTDVPDSSQIRWSHDHRHYYTTVPPVGWYNFSSDFPLREKFDTQTLVFPINSVLKSLSDLPAGQLSNRLAKFVKKAIVVACDLGNNEELPPFAVKRHYSLYGKLSPKIAKDIDSFLIIENITSLSWGSSYNLWLFNVKADKLVSCVAVLGHYKNKIYRLQKGLFIEQCDVLVPGVMPHENRKELDSLGIRKNEITYNIVRINEEGLVVW